MRPALLIVAVGCAPSAVKVAGPDTGSPEGADGGSADGADGAGGDGAGADGADGADGSDGGGAAPCGLAHDLESPHLWEGDTVRFSVRCASGPGEGYEITLISGPAGAAIGPDGAFSWASGAADGGRHDLLLGAALPGSGAIPETLPVTVWLADDPALGVPPAPAAYTEEWGVPVVHLAPSRRLSETDVPTEITVYGHTFDGDAQIRGAASAGYPKPSYTIGFGEEQLELPGWPYDREHLVLISNFDDNSHVRQRLVYEQWAAMSADVIEAGGRRLVPFVSPVVVYIDGEYRGLYLACDRFDNELMRKQGFTDGGGLYKAVSHDANFYLTDASGWGKGWLAAGYEKTSGGDEGDYSELEALVAFTGAASDASLAADGPAWIDLDEFIDWFWLVEVSLAEDSAGKNSYLYADPEDGRFRFGPWDFNHAYGQGWYTYRTDARTWNDYTWNNRVFLALQADPGLRARFLARFDALRAPGMPLSADWMLERIDAYEAELGPHIARDWDRWRDEYRSYGGWSWARGGDWTEADEELRYVRGWVVEREAAVAAWPL